MHACLMNTTQCLAWSGFLHNLPRYMISLPVLLIYSYCAEKEPNRAIVIATQSKCNQIKNRQICMKKIQLQIKKQDSVMKELYRIIEIEILISYLSVVCFFFLLVTEWTIDCSQNVITNSPVKTCIYFTQVTPSQATRQVWPRTPPV